MGQVSKLPDRQQTVAHQSVKLHNIVYKELSTTYWAGLLSDTVPVRCGNKADMRWYRLACLQGLKPCKALGVTGFWCQNSSLLLTRGVVCCFDTPKVTDH